MDDDRVDPRLRGTVSCVSPSITAEHICILGRGEPVTIGSAAAAGITRSQIRASIHAGTLQRIRHGVIAPVTHHAMTHREKVLRDARSVLARVDSDVVVSHRSAAILHELPLPPYSDDDDTIHLTSLRWRRFRLPGATVHAARGDVTDHIIHLDGIPVLSELRTAVDVARGRSLSSALIPLDAAVRRCVVADPRTHHRTYDDERAECVEVTEEVLRTLSEQVRSLKFCTGIDGLRRASLLANPLSESPLESASRGGFIDAGVIPHALQFRFTDGQGRARRADFLLVPGLIGEADGLIKYVGEHGEKRLRAEKLCDLAAAEVAIRTLRWSAIDVWQRRAAWIRHARREISALR